MSAATGHLAQIRCHPVKTLGYEPLDQVTLNAGQVLPGDRAFAVLHEGGLRHLEDGALTRWLPKSMFLRGAAADSLQAVKIARVGNKFQFRHPDLPDLEIIPKEDGAKLMAWLAPLWPDNKPAPAQLIHSTAAQTDSSHPRISILSLDSLRALEHRMGQPIGSDRWRGNLWIEGFDPLAERDWIDREVTIGPARLKIVKPIERCSAVEASTETGARDSDMLAALTDWCGAPDFGIFGEVIEGGTITPGDEVRA